MGRTNRNRSRKKYLQGCANIYDKNIIANLLKWMSSKGWRPTCALKLTGFQNTGRGLMALRKINIGEALVSIPSSLLITTATVSSSACAQIISTLPVERKRPSFSSQQLLAFFLVWEKHLGGVSPWNNYIMTLPSTFSTPHSLQEEYISALPEFLQNIVVSSRRLAHEMWVNLLRHLKIFCCYHCKLSVEDIVSWKNFLWGWCCVNTRAVYIEPKLVPPHNLPVEENDCLALAPYLDMLNHSDEAEVKAGLNSESSCYEIFSHKPIKRFQEVLINYGPHSNIKLFTEYGFVIPSNKHDIVPLAFSDLKAAFTSAEICLLNEYEKKRFLSKHGFLMNMFISRCGISWNTLTAMKILICPVNSPQLWKATAFSGNDRAEYSNFEFHSLVERLFSNTIDYLLKSLRMLEDSGACGGTLKPDDSSDCARTSQILLLELVSVVQAANNTHKTMRSNSV